MRLLDFSRLGRSAGPGPFGLGLPRIIAADFRAVNPPKTLPHAPPIGGLGELFLHKFPGRFLARMAKVGISGAVWPSEFPVNFFQPWGTIGGS